MSITRVQGADVRVGDYRGMPRPKRSGYNGEFSSAVDGRRAKEEEVVAGAAAAKKRRKPGCRDMSRAWDFTFCGAPVSDALRAQLTALDASTPWFLCQKDLSSTDARHGQNRLLISRKGKRTSFGHGQCRLHEAFTDAENALVNEESKKEETNQNKKEKKKKNKKGKKEENKEEEKEENNMGLMVTALDRHGRKYSLRCRYLTSDFAYRFISGWLNFLTKNNLVIGPKDKLKRRVTIEMWAFRSRRLLHASDDNAGHPDGALGMVILHHDEGDDSEQGDVGAPPDEEMETVEEAAVVQEEAVHAEKGDEGAPADCLETLAASVMLVLRTSTR